MVICKFLFEEILEFELTSAFVITTANIGTYHIHTVLEDKFATPRNFILRFLILHIHNFKFLISNFNIFLLYGYRTATVGTFLVR